MLLQHWLRYILLALAIRTATGTRHSRSSSYNNNSNFHSHSNNVAAYKLSTAKQGLGLGKHAARSACWLKQMLNVWNCNKLACEMWQYPWQTYTHTHTRSETMTIFASPKTNDVAERLGHWPCVLIVKLKCSAINCKMAKKCTIRIRIFVSWVQFNYSSISHRPRRWQWQATGRVSVHLERMATICLWNRHGL